jgi:hypothetical protein
MLARPEEVAEFTEAVDDLRDAVERAASRLTALENGQQSVRRPTAVSATDAMAQQSADAGGPAGSE